MILPLRRVLVSGAVVALAALTAFALVRAASPDPASAGLAAGGDPASAAVVAPADAGPVRGDAAAGDDAIATEIDAVLAADQTAAAAPERAAVRGAIRRFAAWNRLVHATVVVDLKAGGLTTIQLDHGTIAAVGASSITITEAGGGSVTVALGSDTRVRRDGAKAAAADLKVSDNVFVMSKVEAGGTTAYLVVVPMA